MLASSRMAAKHCLAYHDVKCTGDVVSQQSSLFAGVRRCAEGGFGLIKQTWSRQESWWVMYCSAVKLDD